MVGQKDTWKCLLLPPALKAQPEVLDLLSGELEHGGLRRPLEGRDRGAPPDVRGQKIRKQLLLKKTLASSVLATSVLALLKISYL